MHSMNNYISLLGNLGDEPQYKELENGKKVLKVSLATNSSFRNPAGETKTTTQWHSLIAWNGTAELMHRFLQKGSLVLIEGKIVNRKYDTEKGKRYFTEILVNQFRNMTQTRLPF